MEQVPDGKDVACSELGRCATDCGCIFRYLKVGSLRIQSDLSNNLNHHEAGHDLGERGDLPPIILALTEEDLAGAAVRDGPTLRGDEWRRQVNQKLVDKHFKRSLKLIFFSETGASDVGNAY